MSHQASEQANDSDKLLMSRSNTVQLNNRRWLGTGGRAAITSSAELTAISMGWVRGLAGEPGFEPRLTESESVVLPLNYSPMAGGACAKVKRPRARGVRRISARLVAAIAGGINSQTGTGAFRPAGHPKRRAAPVRAPGPSRPDRLHRGPPAPSQAQASGPIPALCARQQ